MVAAIDFVTRVVGNVTEAEGRKLMRAADLILLVAAVSMRKIYGRAPKF